MIERRKLLVGMASCLLAPAVVRADSLMPVSSRIVGMTMTGKGPIMVAGLSAAGQVIVEMVEQGLWTKTRWRELYRVDGYDLPSDRFPHHTVASGITIANETIAQRFALKERYSNGFYPHIRDTFDGHPVMVGYPPLYPPLDTKGA